MTRVRVAITVMACMLFAVAFGIALGAGPLQEDINDVFLRGERTAAPDPEQAREVAALRRTVRLEHAALDEIAPAVLAGRLTDRPVAVLALPGAASGRVDAVVADLESAGAAVTTRLEVGADLVDPAARTLVDTLSAGQLEEYDDLSLPRDAGVYERVGAVLARAVVTTSDDGEPVDDGARSVLNGFTTAGLLRGTEPEQRASLVVVVAGPAAGEGETETARSSIVATLAGELRKGSDGVVVAGPTVATGPGGALAGVRDAGDAVSTMASLGSRLGPIGAVLALAEQVDGGSGHYGTLDAPDGVMPG